MGKYEVLLQIAEPLMAALLAVIGYLTRSYFKTLEENIKQLHVSLARHDGRSEALQRDIRDNTLAMVKLQSEVNALWRFMDASNQRTSDRAGR